MVTLSSVGSEGHLALGELVRTGRAEALNRIEERLSHAVANGELSDSVDLHSLACFVQTVQSAQTVQTAHRFLQRTGFWQRPKLDTVGQNSRGAGSFAQKMGQTPATYASTSIRARVGVRRLCT